jgi:DNA-binding PadR family transcriptional regulator
MRALFMGRHFGGRGSGRFAGGFTGPPGFGGGDFRSGRKLASADLQLLILALLAEKPRHGYELIKAFEERSNGFYSPSPGMIYPALTYLEELGHAKVEVEGSRKLYHITSTGRDHLSQNRATVDSLFAQLDDVGRRMDRVRRAFAGTDEAEDEAGPVPRGRGFREMWLLYRELGLVLRQQHRGASAADAKNVLEVLRRAVDELRSQAASKQPRPE